MTTPAAAKPHPGQFQFVTNALQTMPAAEDDGGRRRFRTVMSSTIKDRMNNEVRLSALEDLRDAFRAGRVIYRNHDYVVPDSIFGQSDYSEIIDSGQVDAKTGTPIWDVVVGGWVLDTNAKAVELADAIDAGIRVGASIGAWPLDPKKNRDGGLIIEHLDVIEGSIVGIPKNQRSLVQKAVDAMATWSAVLPVVEDEDEEESPAEDAGETVETIDETIKSGESMVVGDAGPEAVVAGELSSKSRGNLGAEQFACPEKRKYPIHDAAHVRAALSRVADPSNDQCGKDKIMAAARRMGIGDHKADITDAELLQWALDNPVDEPAEATETTDAAEAVAEDSESTSEPTPGGQEAEAATPETAPEPETEGESEVQASLTYRAEEVAQLVAHVARLVETVSKQSETIATLTTQIGDVRIERDRLAAEVPSIRTLIEKAMAKPLRPQAQAYITNAIEKFAMFDPEVAASIAALTQE